MSFWLLVLHLTVVSLATGQFVRPSSILESLKSLDRQQLGYRPLKAAVRSNWLSQRGSRSYGEHYDKRNLATKHEDQLVLQNGTKGSNSKLDTDVRLIFDKLSAAGSSIECSWDDSLLADFKQVASSRYLLAANFKDNEDVLPHIILETWRFLSLLPSQNVFVSIYESGSENRQTAKWLEVFSKILAMSEVQHQIVTGGTLIRGENDSRIDFLAKVRNKALEPLWKLANHSPGTEKKKAGLAVEPWKADRIVFMNDVFVCAKDFMRLLLHDVDMACGLDFGDRDKEDLEEDKWGEGSQEKTLQFLPRGLTNRRLKDMHIYDKWVIRDSEGMLMDSKPGYTLMHSAFTKQRLLAGLPFPATSCWNGLVVIAAKPLLDGLRFRDHVKGECRASECSLLCHDLRRLNYTNIIVDPGVQLAYERHDAVGLHIGDVVGNIQRTTWDDLRNAPPIKQSFHGRDSEICCHADLLNWADKPLKCQMENFMEPNHTKTAFPSL